LGLDKEDIITRTEKYTGKSHREKPQKEEIQKNNNTKERKGSSLKSKQDVYKP